MQSNRRAVLHIDDDPQILRLIHKHLTNRGFEVTSLSDPWKTSEYLLDTDFRVVILDIDMPRNGIDILQEIKRNDGGIQVIILTGLVSMSMVLQTKRCGAEACLFKPLTDFAPLDAALEASFVKIDWWWSTLRDLTDRKRQEASTATELGSNR